LTFNRLMFILMNQIIINVLINKNNIWERIGFDRLRLMYNTTRIRLFR